MCSVPKCKNDPQGQHKGVLFFLFPADENKHKIWSNAIGRDDVSRTDLICSVHFDSNSLIRLNDRTMLTPNAVPTLHIIDREHSKPKDQIDNHEKTILQQQHQMEILGTKIEYYIKAKRFESLIAKRFVSTGTGVDYNTSYNRDLTYLKTKIDGLEAKLKNKNKQIKLLRQSIRRKKNKVRALKKAELDVSADENSNDSSNMTLLDAPSDPSDPVVNTTPIVIDGTDVKVSQYTQQNENDQQNLSTDTESSINSEFSDMEI